MTTTYDSSKDSLKNFSAAASQPGNLGTNSNAVTPSDTVDFTTYPKGIVVTAAGNLVVLPLKGTDGTYITFTGVPAGFVVPFRVRRVMSTNTTASVATIED